MERKTVIQVTTTKIPFVYFSQRDDSMKINKKNQNINT